MDKIIMPARRMGYAGQQAVIRLTPEAYNALVDIYNESTLSLRQIASKLIIAAAEHVEYEKEE
ncbi:MAG: hypothetical protein ACK5MN_03290 [Lachnospiraceae bacterium]